MARARWPCTFAHAAQYPCPSSKSQPCAKLKIIADEMTEVEVECGGLKRQVKLWHMRFPWNGGSWSFFLCPHCGRKCAILRLYDGRFTCRLCDGLGRDRGKNIDRLRQTLAKPRLHMGRQDRENLPQTAPSSPNAGINSKDGQTLSPQDLDPGELILKALTKAEGSILKAAKALNVRTAELRRFCMREKALTETALEAAETALDKAEAQVFRSLRKGPLSTRMQAAAFILKSRRRSR